MDALLTETTDLGTFCECRSCGSSNYSDKKIVHRRRCETPTAQYGVEAPVVAASSTTDTLKVLASNVRKYGLSKGRDEEVYQAVRGGYLSESDAMNTDD